MIACPNNANGLYPHPYDWTKYLNCRNGITLIKSCPSKQVFSLSKNICEPEQRVPNTDRCNNGTKDYAYQEEIYENFQTVDSTDVNYCEYNKNGLIAHPNDCTKYINCLNGKGEIQSCAPGTAWSVQMEVCDHIENVQCKTQNANIYGKDNNVNYQWNTNQNVNINTQEWNNRNVGHTEYTEETQVIKCPPKLSGLFVYPFMSSKYVICQNAQTKIQKCNTGSVFSISKRLCADSQHIDALDTVGDTEVITESYESRSLDKFIFMSAH